MEEISVSFVTMPDGCNGRTNGTDTIWINKDLTPTEARCTMVHEAIHVELVHTVRQRPSVERWVEYETARRMITIPQLTRACRGARSLNDVAFELGVTCGVLMDRASILSDAEARAVGCDHCQLCPVMSQRFRHAA